MSVALLVLLAVSTPPEPECVAKAREVVTRVERMPMRRRRGAIDAALLRDPAIACGVADRKFFEREPLPPAGCTPAKCAFPKGLEAAVELIEGAGFSTWLKVQVLATRLREAGLFSASHERLLSTLLLSAAVEREAEAEHDH